MARRLAHSSDEEGSSLIPGLDRISADSLTFAVAAIGLVLLAWSEKRRVFLWAYAIASAVMLLSWLTPQDLAALLLFLVPPYFAVVVLWGGKRTPRFAIAATVVTWETLLFIYLRKYEWAGSFTWLDHPIAIIGLSYMLFRVIHLIIEAPNLGAYRLSPLAYGTYVLGFWTLLSGPIQRYEAFCDGMATVGRPDGEACLAAAHRAVTGLIKAFVIAPVFLKCADIGALRADGASWIDFAIVLYSYPAYLYLNFSGYTDFVISIARLCGVATLPENFDRPYLARNLLDFWNRWHISFGTWIRHYIFTPLSKWLVGSTRPALHNAMLALSVIATFIIVGAWHGTTLNFLIFGLLHGGAIILVSVYGHILKAALGRQRRKAFLAHPLVHGCSVVLCFHFVAATVLLFPNPAAELADTLRAFLSANSGL